MKKILLLMGLISLSVLNATSLDDLKNELNKNHDIEVHSYILMPMYFEFLATPKTADSLSKFMQSLGRKYVGY